MGLSVTASTLEKPSYAPLAVGPMRCKKHWRYPRWQNETTHAVDQWRSARASEPAAHSVTSSRGRQLMQVTFESKDSLAGKPV